MIGCEIERFLRQRDPHVKVFEEAHDAVRPKDSGAYLCRASDWSPLGFRLSATLGRGRREVAAYLCIMGGGDTDDNEGHRRNLGEGLTDRYDSETN